MMSIDHLQRFLIEVQQEEKATVEDAQAILDSLHEFKHLNIFHRKALNLEAFFKYLFGDINPPLSTALGVILDFRFHFFFFCTVFDCEERKKNSESEDGKRC